MGFAKVIVLFLFSLPIFYYWNGVLYEPRKFLFENGQLLINVVHAFMMEEVYDITVRWKDKQ